VSLGLCGKFFSLSGLKIASITSLYLNVIMRLLLTFIIISIVQFANSQHLILKSFDAYVHDNQVHLSWVIKGGYQCAGTFIERTEDTLKFERLGEIPGVCGGDEEIGYSFVDSNPVINKISYYRLIMGNQGPSSHIEIEVLKLTQNLTILSNPMLNTSRILFENRTNRTHFLNIYSQNGSLIKSVQTNSNNVNISNSELSTGFYILQLIDEDGVSSSGKLIVP
jgi:hypothetical protein